MISDVLLVAGVGVLSAAMRSFQHPVLFRLGTFGLVATSFLAGWLLGGSMALGAAFASTWFLLPWLEILTRVRKMRLPVDRRLESCPPPSRAAFPIFGELSDEVEAAGFSHVEDCAWSHDDTRQFYRVFRHDDGTRFCGICLVEQGALAFYYVTVTSKTLDGRTFATWNYPFSYSLRLPPTVQINRVGGTESVASMISLHEDFLRRLGIERSQLRELEAGNARVEMQAELRQQVDHNLACGVLKRDGPDFIRYSIRGFFFLWVQFLRDFVRLS